MAALVRHGLFKTGHRNIPKNVVFSGFATKAEKKKGIDRKKPPPIDSAVQSIASRGFLRSIKAYSPPEDVSARLESVIKNQLGSLDHSYRLDNLYKRFDLLNACFVEFEHSVPNSILYKIKTVDDVIEFYNTPVDTTTPLDKFKRMDLPENLHIQYEYHRFHPDTDKKFNGVTAFPKSSTIVTGLKYKDKYKGHKQATQWPFK